jgi:drug/metabolite transporter (DMT)-like permease
LATPKVEYSTTITRTGGARLALNALFLGALGIAFAPIFVRISQVGPSATAFWRLALAWPALFLWMKVESRGQAAPRRPSSRSDYLRLVMAGLFFAGDLAIWHWSIRFTSVANATLLANFAPIFVALGSWLFFRQKVSSSFIMGMGVALAGTVFMVGQSFRLNAQHLWGDALGLVTAIFYAGYLLSVKELRSEFSTATIMTWSGIVSCLVLLPVTLLSGEGLLPANTRGWWVLLGLALISHFGGQSLIAFALAKLPAAFSSVALLVQPAAAAVFAWLILSEALSPWQALGGVLALAGIFVARRASL